MAIGMRMPHFNERFTYNHPVDQAYQFTIALKSTVLLKLCFGQVPLSRSRISVSMKGLSCLAYCANTGKVNNGLVCSDLTVKQKNAQRAWLMSSEAKTNCSMMGQTPS